MDAPIKANVSGRWGVYVYLCKATFFFSGKIFHKAGVFTVLAIGPKNLFNF